jgi:hypothetical protein
MTLSEYFEYMLDGMARTMPYKRAYQDAIMTEDVTATCALGAARYSYALQEGFETRRVEDSFYNAESVINEMYYEHYGVRITSDSDQHGRDYAVSRLKEMINDSE